MIGSILLAVDASPVAETTTAYASFLCQKLDARLKVVYVIDARLVNMSYWTDYGAISVPSVNFSEEMNELLQSQGKALLQEIQERMEAAGIFCETEMRTGIPHLQILEAAQAADLILIGCRGESSKLEEAKGLGAVAERVVRGSSQPVFVAAEQFTPLRRIVLGFDGSERAREAMVYAVEMAQRLELPLVALSVHDDEKVAQKRLEAVRSYANGRDLELALTPLSSDPAEAMLAQVIEGDLIAMGAFGEGRVRALLLGSTTESMLRATSQPFLLHR